MNTRAQALVRRTEPRLRAAVTEDVPALEHFIAAYTGDGTLLPRTRANLLAHWQDFVVLMDGDELVGCGALQQLDADLAEVRSVAVLPDRRGHGLGGQIVDALVEQAHAAGFPRVFCLTRRVPFFARHGFIVVAKEQFPQKIWNDCRLCPRQTCCDEVAMQLDGDSNSPGDGR